MESKYADESGRSLDAYPRPSVAVDTAVLTASEVLCVLLVDVDGAWRLPGTFLHEGETLSKAVLRSLRDKAGVIGLSPRQLHVFDDPHRDNRGWVLSVAHIDVVPMGALAMDPQRARLVPVSDLPTLPYGHGAIVERAVASLRTDYSEHPDPHGLLAEPFTLRELQLVHEVVAASNLPRDTFRRTMEPQLRPTGELQRGTIGKPGRLFTRGAAR